MISIYKNFSNKLGDENILNIFQLIKSGRFKNEIKAIRDAKKEKKLSEADKLKSNLLAFTPSGTFGDKRKKEFLKSYSKIINLDFDHIPQNKIKDLVTIINECKFTYGSFISPSGEGIKVFIKINLTGNKSEVPGN